MIKRTMYRVERPWIAVGIQTIELTIQGAQSDSVEQKASNINTPLFQSILNSDHTNSPTAYCLQWYFCCLSENRNLLTFFFFRFRTVRDSASSALAASFQSDQSLVILSLIHWYLLSFNCFRNRSSVSSLTFTCNKCVRCTHSDPLHKT